MFYLRVSEWGVSKYSSVFENVSYSCYGSLGFGASGVVLVIYLLLVQIK